MALALVAFQHLLAVFNYIWLSKRDSFIDVTHGYLLSNPLVLVVCDILHDGWSLIVYSSAFITLFLAIVYNIHTDVNALVVLYLVTLRHLA